MNITATFLDGDHDTGVNRGGEKEMASAYSVISLDGGEMRETVTARSYTGRSRGASTMWATVWIAGRDGWRSGSGSAGGYGYHKESAAIQAALIAAGVQLSEAVGGRGDGALRDALLATAEAARPGCKHFLVCH